MQIRAGLPGACVEDARDLRIRGLVHRFGEGWGIPRIYHDAIHALVDNRSYCSRHRRRHHWRTGAQRLDHHATDEVLERREHKRLAGLEGALERLVVHRAEKRHCVLDA